MVILSFSDAAQNVVLRLTVEYGHVPAAEGDGSWLDPSFRPFSERLGREISYQDDAEEWARSLPTAYAGSEMQCVIVRDDLQGIREVTPTTSGNAGAGSDAKRVDYGRTWARDPHWAEQKSRTLSRFLSAYILAVTVFYALVAVIGFLLPESVPSAVELPATLLLVLGSLWTEQQMVRINTASHASLILIFAARILAGIAAGLMALLLSLLVFASASSGDGFTTSLAVVLIVSALTGAVMQAMLVRAWSMPLPDHPQPPSAPYVLGLVLLGLGIAAALALPTFAREDGPASPAEPTPLTTTPPTSAGQDAQAQREAFEALRRAREFQGQQPLPDEFARARSR